MTRDSRTREDRLRWLLVVVAALAALVAIDVWWIATYRHGQPLTIDESGYIAFALADHFSLQGGGLHALWESASSQAPYAPLVPAVTSVAYAFKTGVLEAFGVLIGFLILLTVAAYGIGERLAGPRLGALAALVVATLPGTFTFTRLYIFALPVAALLSCAVYALLRSDGLRSRGWAIACGVALGLMVLARTMTIAFVPVILLVALFAAVLRGRYAEPPGGLLRQRFLNFGLTVLAGLVVAAPWYIRNYKPVFDYLTSFGYGSQSVYYGPDHSLLSWDRWRDVASRLTQTDLLLPMAALILLGLLAVLVGSARRVAGSPDRRAAATELLGGDAFSVAAIVAGCYVVLTSSRNGGDGFTIPLAVLLPPLAVIALRRVRARIAIAAVAAVVLVAGLNVASNTSLWDSLARQRLVSVPGFGSLPWIDGTPQAVSAIREQDPGPETRFADRDRGWQAANEELAALVFKLSAEGVQTPVAFASRNYALNTSSLLLATMLDQHTRVPMLQLTAEPSDAESTYFEQLTSPAFGSPGILVTMTSNARDLPPAITQSFAEAAARRAGFRRVKTIGLPDGRHMRVWARRDAPPAQ